MGLGSGSGWFGQENPSLNLKIAQKIDPSSTGSRSWKTTFHHPHWNQISPPKTQQVINDH